MSKRQFTLNVAMNPLDQLVPLAQAAEAAGFTSIGLPDAIFYPEVASAPYPYTPDGTRMWNENTPWADPLLAATAMAAATSTIRYYTQVIKLGSRNPVLLARQISSVAHFTGNRFGLGVGIGWAPEEFLWCGAPYENRGKRVNEMIEVIKLLLTDEMVEYHGEFFDFDRLKMSPAPTEPVPIYVGGHVDAALRRAAKYADGWSSAMMTFDELTGTMARLERLREEYGRADEPFEIQAFCIDRFSHEGYEEQFEAGVTDILTSPWPLYGLDFDSPLDEKIDVIKRFAEENIAVTPNTAVGAR
ncbi:TIGR03619 family F420-dependent LLM class oxidoreductase [Gordonia neofelifaecis]|uniref:Oxidoreductase n=1 Tax=Gordonia neofelifaecis NRRL B-59395 TaxID=644548 RepID=F1YIA1_9ACTN|nr:TIGR03619 family F420-dependent LLM class oxidoreductase [Gordonia neofelifaecis]EGD55655.1 oxidoreductase [Gordonia neofelifaecis NRRL B-59395]